MKFTAVHVCNVFTSARKMPNCIKKFMIASTVLSQLALPGLSYAAAKVFSDNLENGTTNAWAQDSDRNKCIAVTKAHDGGTPHSGAYMMECNWNGQVTWDNPASFSTVVLPSWNYTNEFFLRFWYRADQDVDHAMGSKMLRLWGQSDGTCWSTQFEQGDQANLWMMWDIGGNEFPNYFGSKDMIGNHQWHKMEAYVKNDTNGNDGIIRVWVDGNKVWEMVNAKTHTSGTKFYPLYIVSNWDSNSDGAHPGWDHDASNHIYFDDFELFSDYGTGATGSMADASIGTSGTGGASGTGGTTTLSPPQNLHIQSSN